MRRVVCNTGPLLHLREAEALDLLRHIGEVYVPRAVDLEMTQHQAFWHAQRPAWIQVASLSDPYGREATAWRQAGLLDLGEAEAVALARQMRAQWFLTDDAAARLFAQSLGVEVHGSLGVVLWAAAVRHLNHAEAEATLDRLARSSLWMSRRVLAEAQAALHQLFA